MLVYRAIMGCLAPVLLAVTLVAGWRGRLAPGALAERLGLVPRRAPGPLVWLHGASNGEVTSARAVIARLQAARPGLRVLVTANTGTAVAMVRAWALPGVTSALAPLDAWGAAGRLIGRQAPGLLVVVENELWPARLAAARAAGLPVALIGARLSPRSAARWRRLAPGLVRRALAGLAFASAQDEGSAARLLALGLPKAVLGPVVMLKAAVAPGGPAPRPTDLARDRVLLAASTHPGEEAAILAAFAQARDQFRLLILAPRHPRRSAEVAGLIAAAGLPFARRSEGAWPGAGGEAVFLADTMGEMPLWYAAAGVTVIGGSFVPLGGHTPFEPAAAGSALVHGPFMENFADAARALAAQGAALSVSRGGLGAALLPLDAARQASLAARARLALGGAEGVEGLADALVRLLPDATRGPQG